MHSHDQLSILLLIALMYNAMAYEEVKHDNSGVRFPLIMGK